MKNTYDIEISMGELSDKIRDFVKIGGFFTVVCHDPNGNLKWVETTHNLITNEGLDHVLNVILHGATQITTWYLALFENDHTPAAGNTYATPGFTETTSYDEATRQAYNEAASSSQSVTNSANKAVITISASITLYGLGLVGGGSAATTKANTDGGGTLFNVATFATAREMIDDDTLSITYTAGAADDGV